MQVKIKPNQHHNPFSEGFVIGNPGLNSQPVSVSGLVQLTFAGKGKKPAIDSLIVYLEGFLKTPKKDSTHPILGQAMTLMQGNKYTSPYTAKLAATTSSSSAQQNRQIDIPFTFPIAADLLPQLPPSIQLSLNGPTLNSPCGLKYNLRVVCKYTNDLAIPHDNMRGFYDSNAGSLQTALKQVSDARALTWPHFKESHLLDVVKSDILIAWMEARGAAESLNGSFSSSSQSGSQDASSSSQGVSNQSFSSGTVDNMVETLLKTGNGNPVRRLGRTLSNGLSIGENGIVEVLGKGGWQGVVEFESDTICYGDKRSVAFQVLEPEYYKLLKEQQNDSVMPPLRRGIAHFEVILVESWNWVGLQSGSREISLLEVSEATIEEFAKEQKREIDIAPFLLPSIRVPYIEISHKLVFRFRIPRSPVSHSSRARQFDHSGNILHRIEKTESYIPISAVKSLAGRDFFQDENHIVSAAPLRVCAFTRNEADFILTDALSIPPTISNLLPPNFSVRNKNILQLRSQASSTQGFGGTNSLRRLSNAANRILSRHGSTKSKSSSESSSSPPTKFHSMQQLNLPPQPTSQIFTAAPAPPGFQQQRGQSSPLLAGATLNGISSSSPTIHSTHTPSINSVQGPVGVPAIARGISNNGNFGLIRPIAKNPQSSVPTAITSPAHTIKGITSQFYVADLPLPPPPPLVSSSGSAKSNSTLNGKKHPASENSGSSTMSTKFVSTMDKELCQNLSKSGFL
ncbi:UNVERIFIED_CONTAM: hypothetical protein HDU68_004319 [Siphonaria sp. JEL0065]|nr:hypothetical protein HDU68_004319 [Siphonaria sp. JEL0065]